MHHFFHNQCRLKWFLILLAGLNKHFEEEIPGPCGISPLPKPEYVDHDVGHHFVTCFKVNIELVPFFFFSPIIYYYLLEFQGKKRV